VNGFLHHKREPAMQVCPVAAKMPDTAPLTASSRSASSNTMFGDLPPSSSPTFLKLSGRGLIDDRAGRIGSGEGILRVSGCSTSGMPDFLAETGDDVHTRAGSRLLDELDEFQRRTPT
jgi:hypothetical protein